MKRVTQEVSNMCQPNHRVYREEGQVMVEWLNLEEGHIIESMQSELLAIVKEQPFGEESRGFYVRRTEPEYGLFEAVKIPVPEEEEFVIDLGW